MIIVVCVGIIGGMIYYNLTAIVGGDDAITTKIDEIDITCPACPDLTNPINKEDIETLLHDKLDLDHDHKPGETTKCPSVTDIVTAIFPGRNTGITKEGRYFDIKSNESYELLPDYSFFKPEDAFPTDTILDQPLRDSNLDISQNQIDNTQDGLHTDTQGGSSVSGSQTRMRTDRGLSTRMNQGLHESDRLKRDFKNTIQSKTPSYRRPGMVAGSRKEDERDAHHRDRADIYR